MKEKGLEGRDREKLDNSRMKEYILGSRNEGKGLRVPDGGKSGGMAGRLRYQEAVASSLGGTPRQELTMGEIRALELAGEQERMLRQSDKYWMERGEAAPGLGEYAVSPMDVMVAPAGLLAKEAVGAGSRAVVRIGSEGIRRGVGRMVTNLVDPTGAYSLESVVNDVRREGVKKAIRAVVKDEPLYGARSAADRYLDESLRAVEVPYRKMFGLEPRWGRDLLRETGNPNELALTNDAIRAFGEPESVMRRMWQPRRLDELAGKETKNTNIAFGDYKLRYHPNSSTYEYTDLWDFGLDPGEADVYKGRIRQALRSLADEGKEVAGRLVRGRAPYRESRDRMRRDIRWIGNELSVVAARKFVDKITNPQTIHGFYRAAE